MEELDEIEAQKEADRRRQEELVRRFRADAFRQKMKLFGAALISNIIFVAAIWILPSSVTQYVFLLYILIGAIPKFIFGSLLKATKKVSKKHVYRSSKKHDDPEGNFQWHISVPPFRCPSCGEQIMGWAFCKTCGFQITDEHPTLVTACCTVHHEDDKGIVGGVRSFEISDVPFQRRYLHIVYIVDGRYDRSGKLDIQQRNTVVFLLSRLFGMSKNDIATGGTDEVVTLYDPVTQTQQPFIRPEDGTAVYRGLLLGETPFTVLVKRTNGGKRDSHRLFFEYLHHQVIPRTAIGIMFMDSDTILAWDNHTDSFKKLFECLCKSENNGGACGEIEVLHWTKNPITMMQHFEYKSNQFLAKTAESWFGMVTCLPGAFSMVRPEALETILNDYLADCSTIWERNQLDLGEDRTLTTLLLQEGWDTVYASKAVAQTEVPSTLIGLIKQRRRWINSTIVNMALLLKRIHRPAALPLLIPLALELVSTFTLPTTVLTMFVSIFEGMNLYQPFVVGIVVLWSIALVLVSLTTTAEKAAPLFKASTSIGAFMIAIMLVQIIQGADSALDKSFLALLVMVGWMLLVTLASIIHGQWKSVLCIIAPAAWFFLSPCMYVIIPIFALCNFDDVSWGTRG